ncbi:MAG: energy-coupling factor transporter ATPase [Oscillospiraceae bacterium]
MSVIETKGLTYKYQAGMPDEKTAVSNMSVSFEKGDFVGVIGHTGSGKSTFIQHLNGLLRPTEGKVLLDGEDIWDHKEKLREYRFKVGLVFQYPEYQLFEETVYKDVSFGPKNMGLSDAEVDKRVRMACDFVGIPDDKLNISPFELSGGQKRRVAIAGVIAMNPEVLILDEPTAGLDPAGCDEILGEIKRYHEDMGNTVILVSHSMDDIAKYCNKVLVMNEGSLFAYDETAAVYSRSDELEKMGLAIPTVTGIMLALKRRGFDVDAGVYNVQDAVKAFKCALKTGDKKNA